MIKWFVYCCWCVVARIFAECFGQTTIEVNGIIGACEMISPLQFVDKEIAFTRLKRPKYLHISYSVP